jgi:fatty-acyl-CoA synthase
LLIKQLLHTSLMQSPQQEIVYRDVKRLTYADLRDRISRLGSALVKIGVRPGDTVGVLDWDSNRFLEAFFANPMMGVVLQTVTVRLSPEQVAYTIDHAGSSTPLVNDEFVDLVHSILPKLPEVRQLVAISDSKAPATGCRRIRGASGRRVAGFSLSRLRRNRPGDDVQSGTWLSACRSTRRRLRDRRIAQ